MAPASCLDDRPGLAASVIEPGIAAIGIGLQDPKPVDQVLSWMFASAVGRIEEQRRRWCGSSKRPVVSDIGPDPTCCRLAPGQHRHGGIVPVQPFGTHDMGGKPMVQGLEHGRGRTDLIGEGRQAQRNPFAAIALDLPVEWLMLPVLLEQHHRQQAWPGPAASDHMERCRWLADLLAVPAGDLLTHRLDDLPAARNDFKRLGDVFTNPAQPSSAASRAGAGRGNDDAFARQVLGKRLARMAGSVQSRVRQQPCGPLSGPPLHPGWPSPPTPQAGARVDPAGDYCARTCCRRAGA